MTVATTQHSMLRLLTALLLIGCGGGQSNITGPTRCPSNGGTFGYTNLTALRADILLNSAMTGGENGGEFIICPFTTFDFSSKANDSLQPPFNDDLFGSFGSKGDQDPIVVVANNTRIQCGYDGSISNECIFIRGNYHIQVLRGVAGIEIRGLTFRFAKKASIVTAGRGGLITFSNCAWEENSGTGVFLALESNGAANITTPKPSSARKPTSKPSSIRSGSPSLSPTETFQPTSTLLPTITALPSVTPFPSLNSISDAPSDAPSLVRPSRRPTKSPTRTNASAIPSSKPTRIPSNSSTQPSFVNSSSTMPSESPSIPSNSSFQPSVVNSSSMVPSPAPSNFSQQPSIVNITSDVPSQAPSSTAVPTISLKPSNSSLQPSSINSIPSLAPSVLNLTFQPSLVNSTSSSSPSMAPSSFMPSNPSGFTQQPSPSQAPSTSTPSNSSLQPSQPSLSSSVPSGSPSSFTPTLSNSTSSQTPSSFRPSAPSITTVTPGGPSASPIPSHTPSTFRPSAPSVTSPSPTGPSVSPSPSHTPSTFRPSAPSIASPVPATPSASPSTFRPSAPSVASPIPAIPSASPLPSQTPSSFRPSAPSVASPVPAIPSASPLPSQTPSTFRPSAPSVASPIPAIPSASPLPSQTPSSFRPSAPSVASLTPASPSANLLPSQAPSSFRPSALLPSQTPSSFRPSAPSATSVTPAVPTLNLFPSQTPSSFRPSAPSATSLTPAIPSALSQTPSTFRPSVPSVTSLAPASPGVSTPPTSSNGTPSGPPGTSTPSLANNSIVRSANPAIPSSTTPTITSSSPLNSQSPAEQPSASPSTAGSSSQPVITARIFGSVQPLSDQTGSPVDDITVTIADKNDAGNDIIPLPSDDAVSKLFGENDGGRRELQTAGTAFDVTISNCTFLRNAATSAVVLNNGGRLRIFQSEFVNNNSTATVVQVVGGGLKLESSNFVNNSFSTYPAPVITDSKSLLSLNTNNCGVNNSNVAFKSICEGVFALTKSGCKGPLKCEGTCIPFTSLACSSRTCFSDWGMLVNAINTAAQRGQGGIFTLCPMTTFLVDEFSKSQPVIIQQSSTVLQCGENGLRDNSCVIFGGEVQIVILGGATDVIFRGLTMISSSMISVNATGSSLATATFADCEWTGHTGLSVIQVYNGRFQNRGNSFASVAAPKAGMTIGLQNCTIRDNVVSFAALSTYGGVAIIRRTLFFGNTAEAGAIALLYQGKLSLSNSCFAENNALSAPGIVFIDKTSLLALNDNNFGIGNDSTDPKCSAILQQTGGTCVANQTCTGKCILFKASVCAAAELPPLNVTTRTPTPSIAPTTFPKPSISSRCYSKWDKLSVAVRNASAVGKGGVFTICPGSLLNVDLFPQANITPIVIGTSNIVIQCGKLGSYKDKCTIFGGTTQFVIVGSPTAVKFKGLNLVGSQETSVNAFGSQNAQVDFVGCTWARNAGSSAVLVYNGTGNVDPDSLNLPPSKHGGMSVTFSNCTFKENMVSFAPILNLGGAVVVKTSLFTGNDASGGAILVLNSGSVALTDDCFISNHASLTPGVVFIERNSSLVLNRNNFGLGNEASDFTCTAISIGAKLGNANITGSCLQFEATKCSIVNTIASAAPTTQPSSTRGSDVPSHQPSLASQSPTAFSGAPATPSSHPTQSCFKQWDALSLAITSVCSTGHGGIFVLCPNTVFNLNLFSNPLLTPIQVASSNVTLKCGNSGAKANNCVVSGGATQFVIRNAVDNIFFVGITMVGSTAVSVEGGATQGSVATFIDCEWRHHTGNATILVRQIGRVVASMTVHIRNCTLENNNVVDATIVNMGGAVIVERTLFFRDMGQEGAITVQNNGTISLLESCFISNSATVGPGIVFVDESSALVLNKNIFGEGNKAGECTSIFKSGFLGRLNGKCVPFEAESCNLAIPSPEPTSAPSQPCVSEWDTLSLQIQAVCNSGMSAIFIVCPGTIFDLNLFPDPLITPIQFLAGDITLQCGNDGARENRCVVSGGGTQFVIRNSVTGIRFVGMTMIGSTDLSVNAGATADSEATFIDCDWRRNTGNATISIQQIGKALNSMTVNIVNSTLEDNRVADAAIVNVGGALVIERSILSGNRAQYGAVHGLQSGSVSSSDSCFVNNVATLPSLPGAAVVLEGNASLAKNAKNFGEGNGRCNGALTLSSSSRGKRQSCQAFTAKSCPVSNITFTMAPSPIPTMSLSQSAFPSQAPSMFQGTSQLPSMTTSQPTVAMPPSSKPVRTRPPTKPPAPVATPSQLSFSFSYHYNYLIWR